MIRFRWDKPRRTEGEVSWRVQNLSLFGKSSIKKSIFSKLTIWEWNIPISIDIYGCDEGCMDGVWGSEHARTLLIRSFWACLTENWSLSPRYICSLFNIFARLRFRDHHPTYFGTGKCPFLLSVPVMKKTTGNLCITRPDHENDVSYPPKGQIQNHILPDRGRVHAQTVFFFPQLYMEISITISRKNRNSTTIPGNLECIFPEIPSRSSKMFTNCL